MVCRPLDGRPMSTSPSLIAAARDHALALDGTDDEAGQVVLALGVEAGHLGGFATDQRALVLAAGRRHAAHDRPPPRAERAGAEIVEKEERLGPCTTMSLTQWFTRSTPMVSWLVGHEGDLQLRADTVGAGHEHRIAEAPGLEPEEPAERSDIRQDGGCEGGARQSADTADGFVAGVDVDPDLL